MDDDDDFIVIAVNGASVEVVQEEQEIPSPSGTLLLGDNRYFTFTPSPNFTGEFRFTYSITYEINPNDVSDTATVLITVLKPNE